MAADEAGRARRGCDDAGLGRADVGDRRVAGRGEHGRDGGGKLRDRRGDDDELGVGDGVARGCPRRSTRLARDRGVERVGIGVPARDVVAARRAASATDAPINPVPMTAIFTSALYGPRTHELGSYVVRN